MTNASFPNQEAVFIFGRFELVPKRRLLLRDGKPVKIGSRALDLLVVLIEHAGDVIATDELILRVWRSAAVEDTNLRVHISVLRRLLGDDGSESRYIVHVARRGYVFVVPISFTMRPIVRDETILAGAPRPTISGELRAARGS